MKLKRPFEFDIIPDRIETGRHWISVKLKNVSNDELTNLDVRLHSMNPFFLSIIGSGTFV